MSSRDALLSIKFQVLLTLFKSTKRRPLFLHSSSSHHPLPSYPSTSQIGFQFHPPILMSEKMSTLILKVDLECHLCYKKIRKTLCKLQDRERITSIAYDEKNNKVTVSGPFDPDRLTCKLYSKACKVIKDITVKKDEPIKPKDEKVDKPPSVKPPPEKKEPEKPQPPPPSVKPPEKKVEPEKPKDSMKPPEKKEPEKAEKPKPAPAEKAVEQVKPIPKPKPKPDQPDPAATKPAAEKPKPKEQPPRAEPAVQRPGMYYIEPPSGPICSCRPYCEGPNWGGYCSCNTNNNTYPYGWGNYPPPPPPHYQFFCEEEDRNCSIM